MFTACCTADNVESMQPTGPPVFHTKELFWARVAMHELSVCRTGTVKSAPGTLLLNCFVRQAHPGAVLALATLVHCLIMSKASRPSSHAVPHTPAFDAAAAEVVQDAMPPFLSVHGRAVS